MIYLQNNRGVAAVELAICLPILILLVCGSIEFGLLFYNQQVITNASREGVRAGIVAGTVNADIEQIVKNYCGGKLINLNGANELQADAVTVSAPDAQNDLTVRVIYNYNFLFGGILNFTDKILSAQTIMRME
ncbi:MAG: pilus assembly protein [Deltaproteobacteria bacterium]|nr:pilus assembly protein [Deltaproteobacteria bacterium]MBW2663976.1 pilus assembly protein [Deltaproteobacteria bacterium]